MRFLHQFYIFNLFLNTIHGIDGIIYFKKKIKITLTPIDIEVSLTRFSQNFVTIIYDLKKINRKYLQLIDYNSFYK